MYIQVVKDTRDIGFILVDGKEISYNTYSHSGLNAFTHRHINICEDNIKDMDIYINVI